MNQRDTYNWDYELLAKHYNIAELETWMIEIRQAEDSRFTQNGKYSEPTLRKMLALLNAIRWKKNQQGKEEGSCKK